MTWALLRHGQWRKLQSELGRAIVPSIEIQFVEWALVLRGEEPTVIPATTLSMVETETHWMAAYGGHCYERPTPRETLQHRDFTKEKHELAKQTLNDQHVAILKKERELVLEM